MKLLNNLNELESKTIKKCKLINDDEKLILIFDDETCIFFSVEIGYDGEYDILIKTDLNDYDKNKAELISDVEYRQIERENIKRRNEQTERQERVQLAKLTEKYQS